MRGVEYTVEQTWTGLVEHDCGVRQKRERNVIAGRSDNYIELLFRVVDESDVATVQLCDLRFGLNVTVLQALQKLHHRRHHYYMQLPTPEPTQPRAIR